MDFLELVFSLVSVALKDWEEYDLRRYFELAYEDSDMRLYVKTDSSLAAREIAKGVSEMMVERMRLLKAREERKLLGN